MTVFFFNFYFVIPCGITRRGHSFSELCSGRALCGCSRCCGGGASAARRRNCAYRGSFIQGCPHTARVMIISQLITFAPG